MHVCFVVLVSVFQYLAKRLAEKNVSEMTYFVSGGTYSINSVNDSVIRTPQRIHKQTGVRH